MEKVKFSIGLFDKDSRRQEIDTYEAIILIKQTLLAIGAVGLSIYVGKGVYMYDDGTLMREPSVFAEVYNLNNESIQKAVEFLKKELNRESIMVEHSNVKIDLRENCR